MSVADVVIFAAPSTLPHAAESRLERLHRLVAKTLSLRHPVRIVVSDKAVPKGYLAITSRDTDGVCRLVYRKATVSLRVVAHESCHCANDYERLGALGWDPYVVSEKDIPMLERRADACARRTEAEAAR